ncbi:hypothetical protein [Microbacterium sp. YY-01]|uniref:hypothetical protein n=1 Tax=Microbacterium sp. YY-01 TaxID=3421634 RepID=UPI003D16D243
MIIAAVREGSAVIYSEFAERTIAHGDVLLLATNVLSGYEPEPRITATTLYTSTDYAMDQLFWQYAGLLRDRHDTTALAQGQSCPRLRERRHP